MMVTQNSGFEQLELYIETELISFSVKGYSRSAKQAEEGESSLVVKCAQLNSVVINSVSVESNIMNSGGKIFSVSPLFFEQTDYEVVIISKQENNVTFYHEDPNISKLVKKLPGANVLSGNINFYNNVGYSDLIIYVDGHEYFRVRMEIYPSKISYREDFEKLREDVANEVYGLIFDYMNPTYARFGISKIVRKNDFDFGIILDNLYGKIKFAMDIIMLHPHHVLVKEYNVLLVHKVKKTDNKCIKWLVKHTDSVQKQNGLFNMERMMNVKKIISYDTKENRLTKHILKSILRRIEIFKKLASKKCEKHPLYNNIDNIGRNIRNYLDNTFLANVEEEFLDNSMSLVFSMAPGYKELYRYNLLLNHGLDTAEQVLNVHLKQISELYEYWCYIKLNSLLRKKYHLNASNAIVTSKDNFIINLIKGRKSVIRYTNQRNNECFEMLYNNSYFNHPTPRQKPDNVLCLHKILDDGVTKVEFKYVFDAKYRINYGDDQDDTGEIIDNNLTPGPKDEDINVMHRYRDAIVYAEKNVDNPKYKREMFGAYVLFPYDDEVEYRNHKYYKSISQVNIGGLPFLPNHTELVENMLDELINESPFSAEERGILPKNVELELQEIEWSRDVLVGTVDISDLSNSLQYKLYRTTAVSVKYPNMVRCVALYQPKDKFDLQSGVKHWGYVKEWVTIDIDGVQYYEFHIVEWHHLKNIITINEAKNGTRYTNLFALKNSRNTAELFADSKDTWRFLYEMRRILAFELSVKSEMELQYAGGRFVFDAVDVSVYSKNSIEPIYTESIREFSHGTSAKLKKIEIMLRE